MSGLQDIALDSMGVRGGYWATFYLRKWMVLKVFFQSLGRQIRGEGLSTLYWLHFWIRGEGRMQLQGVRVLFSFHITPPPHKPGGSFPRPLPRLRSGTPSPRLQKCCETEHNSVCLSGTLSTYQRTGTVWASTFPPLLVQVEGMCHPELFATNSVCERKLAMLFDLRQNSSIRRHVLPYALFRAISPYLPGRSS